jgi:hypothetical protein
VDELKGILSDPAVWSEPEDGLGDAVVAAIARPSRRAVELQEGGSALRLDREFKRPAARPIL